MKTRVTKLFGKQVMVEGLMAFGKLECGRRLLDFECCEDVEAEPFKSEFKVQGMRDGNLYMEEKAKRVRNKPIFRDDNASLSLGRNRRFYFVFSMEQERAEELPAELVRQAGVIARKVKKQLEDGAIW